MVVTVLKPDGGDTLQHKLKPFGGYKAYPPNGFLCGLPQIGERPLEGLINYL